MPCDPLRLRHDPRRVTLSPFLAPPVHAALRCALAAYAVAVLVTSVVLRVLKPRPVVSWFYYFTNLSFLGLTIYLVLVAAHTAAYAMARRRESRARSPPPPPPSSGMLDRRGSTFPLTAGQGVWPVAAPTAPPPRTLAYGSVAAQAVQMLYITVVGAHVAVPVFYWSVIYSPTCASLCGISGWVNVSQHGMDTLLMLADMMLGSQPLYWRHSILVLALLAVYGVYMAVLQAVRHTPVYAIVDWQQGWLAVGWYAAIVAIFAACFITVKALHRVRDVLALHHGRAEHPRAWYTHETPAADKEYGRRPR